jgi:hypothetical protein
VCPLPNAGHDGKLKKSNGQKKDGVQRFREKSPTLGGKDMEAIGFQILYL